MKCLSAFGVIIDTTKPSVTGNADTNKTVRLYRIIGIKAIDLITGDIEERKCDIFDIDESDYEDISIIDESDYNIFSMDEQTGDFLCRGKRIDDNISDIDERTHDTFNIDEEINDISDIRLRSEYIPNMYIGLNESNGRYDLYEGDKYWCTEAYKNIGLLVYDVGTGKSIIIGSEFVYYKLFKTLVIELNLSTCKMSWLHGEGTQYLRECEADYDDDGCYHEGIPLPTSIGMWDMQEDTVLLDYLTDKESNTIIFDTTVIVDESKDTFIVPSKCKCLELSYRVVVDKLILNKDLCHIEVCDGIPFKTIYVSKESSIGLVCSLIYALSSAYISKVGVNGDIAYGCNCFLDTMVRMPAEEAYAYCYLPENKDILEKILSMVEIVVY